MTRHYTIPDACHEHRRQEGRAAAIADVLRVLEEMEREYHELADGPYGDPHASYEAIALREARERIAALAPAEPPPLTKRAREWADALVATEVDLSRHNPTPSADGYIGVGIIEALAWGLRDSDILAAINEAARRLKGGAA